MDREVYHWVEFASPEMKGFRNLIVDVGDVIETTSRYQEVYTSIFRYSADLGEYMKRNTHGGKPSIAGYDGAIDSHFLFLDIDSKEPEISHDVARKLVSFFCDEWDMPERGLNIAFSGSKGYHIGVDTRVFGELQPSEALHRLHAELRSEIVSLAGIREVYVIDQTICDKTRLWRLVNTRHSKSGLYKVQLEVDELFRLSVEAIKELAQTPRPTTFTDETGLIPKAGIAAIGKAAALYRKSLSKVKKTCCPTNGPRVNKTSDDLKPLREILCEARLNLLKSRVAEGRRNVSALILISALRCGGYSQERAQEVILKWNSENAIGLGQTELIGVLKSAYRAPHGYNFGCNSLKEHCRFAENRNECKDYRLYKFGHFGED